MLNNKIKKIICILSAVIIAFSCFSVSAAQNVEINDDFSFKYLNVVISYFIKDSTGNIIGEDFVEVSNLKYNAENNKLYVDLLPTDSVSLLKPGYRIDFSFMFDYSEKYNSNDYFDSYLLYHFPEGFEIRSSGVLFYSDSSGGFVENASNIGNTFYHSISWSREAVFAFNSERTFDSFSFVVEILNDVDDVEDYIVDSTASPGKYKFFSDMGTFFKSSTIWLVDIFKKVSTVPALTVLVLGFVIVGFGFGLLRKLKE